MGEADTTEERPPEFDSILELTGLDPDQVAHMDWEHIHQDQSYLLIVMMTQIVLSEYKRARHHHLILLSTTLVCALVHANKDQRLLVI